MRIQIKVIAISLVAGVAVASPAGHHKKYVPPKESRTYNCPHGYRLQGKSCTIEEIIPMNFVCPPGSQEINSVCVTYSPVKTQCLHDYDRFGNKCAKTIYAKAVQLCDAEYILNGNLKCEKLVTAAPYCPKGYDNENGQCLRYSDKLYKCPHGYDALGKGCVRKTKLPKVPSCPDDFAFEGEKCVKYVPLPEYCPPGYIQSEIGCSQYAIKLVECPQDFTKASEEHCEKIVTHEKNPACPEGFTLQGEKCIRETYLQPYCPPGYTQESNGCVQYARLLSKCPKGYEITEKDVCIHVQHFPKEPHCPEQYTLKDGKCIKRVPIPPHCPLNFSRAGDRCLQSLPLDVRCPQSYELSHKGCKRTKTVPKIPRCAAGSRLENLKCIRIKQHEVRNVCDVGELIDGECDIRQFAPKLLVCKPGFVLTERECLKEEEYDCSPPVVPDNCESTVYESKNDYDSPRYLMGLYIDPMMSPKEHSFGNTVPSCQKTIAPPPKMCKKTHRALPREVCPDGFDFTDRDCVRSVRRIARLVRPPPEVLAEEAEMICPEGGCEIVEKTEEIRECPNGFERENDRCYKTQELIQPEDKVIKLKPIMRCSGGDEMSCKTVTKKPLLYFCPQHYFERGHKCVNTVEFIIPPPKHEALPPKFVCSDGIGPKCESIEKAPIHAFCPQGYEQMINGDQCVRATLPILPKPKRVVKKPHMICSGGSGPSCEQIEKSPFETFCKTNFVDVGDECANYKDFILPEPVRVTQEPTYVCEKGFELTGRDCIQKLVSAVETVCKTGYQLVHNKCVKYLEKLSICTRGEKVDNKCVALKTQKPKVTIVRTCTKGQHNC